MKAEETGGNLVLSDEVVKRALFESPLAMFLTDLQGYILFCSREALKILGLTESDIVSLPFTTIFLSESGDPFLFEKTIDAALEGDSSLRLYYKRPDGHSLQLNCQIGGVEDSTDTLQAWMFTFQVKNGDDHSNNTIDEVINRSFYQLFQATPQPVAIIDGEGTIMKANSAACQLAGVPENHLTGRNVQEFLPPPFKDKFRSDINAFRDGLTADLGVYEMFTSKGTTKKVKIKADRLGNDFFVGFIIDVTEIQVLKQAAKESTLYLENFFTLAGEGFYITEFDPPVLVELLSAMDLQHYLELVRHTRIINANEALARQYKSTPEEIIGKSLIDFVQHNPENLPAILGSLFKTGRAQYQIELIRSTGEMFLAEGTVVLVRENGHVTKILGIQRDLSEWQRLHDELAESVARLQLAHQVARLGTWDMELNTGNITRNETWWSVLGYGPDELDPSHEGFLSLLHSEDYPRVQSLIHAVLENPERYPEFETEFRLRTKKGTYKWIRSRAKIIKDANGKPIRIIGVHFDVDDYHRTMEVLRLSEITYHGLIDSVSDALYVQDENGAFIEVNLAAERMYGYSKQEIIGKTPDFLSAEGKNDMNAVSMAFEKALAGEPQRFEFWGRRADGSIFPKEVALSPGTYFGMPCVIAIARDISTQIRKNIELNNLVQSLKEANAEKDKFFSLIAHDLKSPLSAIIGITELLAEDADKLTLGEIQRLSRSLQMSATNVYGLLENLLEWSRVRRRMFDFSPQFFTLRQIVANVMDTHAMAAAKKQVGLLNAINDSVRVFADERMVETILRNLVSNAIKFTGRGGFIKVAAYPRTDGNIVVEVKDTGIGIPENIMHQLFSIIGNAQRKGTEGEPSTGLGLPLCKELVEIHGGTIWAENNNSKGSRFSFTLPKDEEHLNKFLMQRSAK